MPFTHLLSVTLNSRYFKPFLFPLTVQNNGVQLYDYDYKNNKKFVPGEGIPLPTKEILIMKTIFYSILAEPQKISNFQFENFHWRHYLSTLAERGPSCMNFFSDIFPYMNFFGFSPPPTFLMVRP